MSLFTKLRALFWQEPDAPIIGPVAAKIIKMIELGDYRHDAGFPAEVRFAEHESLPCRLRYFGENHMIVYIGNFLLESRVEISAIEAAWVARQKKLDDASTANAVRAILAYQSPKEAKQ